MLKQTRLANGVRILSLPIPHAHSVALGVWLVNGSRHEEFHESGYAHLLEHLLFKGTATLDESELAQRFAAMGGQVNAHTGRELSALYGTVPAEDALALSNLFITMLLQPGFNESDIDRELKVIHQEFQETVADPEEEMEEWAISLAWQDHPLARPILSTPAAWREATPDKLRDYLNRVLQGERLLVAATGAIQHDALLECCAPLADLPRGQLPLTTPPSFHPGVYRRRSESTHRHLLWLMPIPGAADPAYPALLLGNELLGGSINAYLFRELRERLGLVYGVHTRLEFYSDAGLWAIHSRCAAHQAERCREVVETALERFMQDGPTTDQLEFARQQLRASLLIEADRLDNLMERMAREAIYLGYNFSTAEWVERLDEVKPEQLSAQFRQAWERRLSAAGY